MAKWDGKPNESFSSVSLMCAVFTFFWWEKLNDGQIAIY